MTLSINRLVLLIANICGPVPINFDNLSIEGARAALESVALTISSGMSSGMSIFDIEYLVQILLVIRFIILTFRYGLKAAFTITCVGAIAGYLWYRRFVFIAIRYRTALLLIPYGEKLGMSAIQLKSLFEHEAVYKQLMFRGGDAQWYQPGRILIYAIQNAITDIGHSSGEVYYIDPISMLIAKLPEFYRIKIEPIYYGIYFYIIPNIYYGIRQFWQQSQALLMYVTITRLGRRFCPYLIRWHWTFLIILACLEAPLSSFMTRVDNYQQLVLLDVLDELDFLAEEHNVYISPGEIRAVTLENEFLTLFVQILIVAHLGFLMFGLLHAFCGQYFYFPLLVESTEGHVGKRPTKSIYAGGQAAWQDEVKTRNNKSTLRLWYGWFGRGNRQNIIKKIFLKIIKYLRNKRKKK